MEPLRSIADAASVVAATLVRPAPPVSEAVRAEPIDRADPKPSGVTTPEPGFGRAVETTLTASRAGSAAGSDADANKGADGLSDAERAWVDALAARDREVRAHEAAHVRVGGPYAGSPSYDYAVGPDGRRYAIGGEVPIDVSPIPNDPAATVDKMRVVEAAALAPAEPSAADRRVAAIARATALAAQADLTAQSAERPVREG